MCKQKIVLKIYFQIILLDFTASAFSCMMNSDFDHRAEIIPDPTDQDPENLCVFPPVLRIQSDPTLKVTRRLNLVMSLVDNSQPSFLGFRSDHRARIRIR